MLAWIAITWALCSAYVAGLWTMTLIREIKDWPEGVCELGADDILFGGIVVCVSVVASPISIVVFIVAGMYDSREARS